MKLFFVIFIVAFSSNAVAVINWSFPESFRPIFRAFSLPPGREPVNSDIMVRIYKTNVTSPTAYMIDKVEGLADDQDFDFNRFTVLYFHGYVELYTDESVVTMMSAYVRAGGYNILLLDWSNLAFGKYVDTVRAIPSAGDYVCQAFQKLVRRGLSVERLHLIGHSLGSHFAGYVSRCLSSHGPLVFRLTGLDPAFPGIYPPKFGTEPMRPTDAGFVDAYHTAAGTYGTPVRTADADVWPNGGNPKQPGCPLITVPFTIESFCSHWRSWRYYAESVNSPLSFLARPCEDYGTFLQGDCDNETVVVTGFRADPGISGNFYLRTNSKSPFGLGEAGAS